MAASSGPLSDLDTERPYAGIVRRTIHGSQHTMMFYELEPNATFPLHRHDEEQTTVILSGEVEFTAGGVTTVLEAGDWSLTSPGVAHGVVAGPEGARFIAVVAPAREHYEVLGGT